MKQSEKLDAILKFLYDKRFNRERYLVNNILDALGIPYIGMDEASALGDRLGRDGYVDSIRMSSDRCVILINTYGIDYCENSSYDKPGKSLMNYTLNMNISNSPNANIISQSSHTNVTVTNYDKIEIQIDNLKKQVENTNTISEKEKSEILECLTEIEACLKSGKKPKFSLATLLSQTANVAGIGSLAIEIGKLINGG